MAYCIFCEKNVQIVMDTSSYSKPVRTRSERFRETDGKLIGYEDHENYIAHTSSIPKCSYCFEPIRYPAATNFHEYKRMVEHEFETKSKEKRKHLIACCKSRIDEPIITKRKAKRIAKQNLKLEEGADNHGWGCLLFSLPIGLILAHYYPIVGYLILILSLIVPVMHISSRIDLQKEIKKVINADEERKMENQNELDQLLNDKNEHLWMDKEYIDYKKKFG